MHHLLLTVGSHGDTHPFIGLGRRLLDRGHKVTLAANELFGPTVTAAGLEFVELGTAEEYRKAIANPDIWHPRKGFKAVFEAGVLPAARRAYEIVTSRYVPGETVVTAHTIALGARVAQEKLGLPLATIHLAPAAIPSAIDPPVFAGAAFMRHTPACLNRLIFGVGERLIAERFIGRPIDTFRAEVGLPRRKEGMFTWWNSPDLVVGLFPSWFGAPAADWPPQIKVTGFPLFDERGAHEMPADLEAFLREGEPPIAFTFGSAMTHAREHLAASAEACGLLGRRGLLVTRYPEQLPATLPAGVRHVAYAPFSELLPRCAAFVHHGGIGTTAQALAAGVPQLVMPFAHDQPDNAYRVRRLGCGEQILPKHYKPARLAGKLRSLLEDPRYRQGCKSVAEKFTGHDPLDEACELIERLGRSHSAAERRQTVAPSAS
jgi:UDP:flavonoid glycosyltransferase YjiC (YdhE family)